MSEEQKHTIYLNQAQLGYALNQTITSPADGLEYVLQLCLGTQRRLPEWAQYDTLGNLPPNVRVSMEWLPKTMGMKITLETLESIHNVYCPHCYKKARIATGAEVYPHRTDLHDNLIWVCTQEGCDARVGTHSSGKPLGTLANAETREWRQKARAAFDPRWKGTPHEKIRRREQYARLANELNIPTADCHIGVFGIKLCKEVIDACDPEGAAKRAGFLDLAHRQESERIREANMQADSDEHHKAEAAGRCGYCRDPLVYGECKNEECG